ncbi:hypothetical protein Leryth_018825 [Lithospermum erythrorhizon]|nr:hypothetical protein Leryth_018825 [Lithospermum erythrorhizon]
MVAISGENLEVLLSDSGGVSSGEMVVEGVQGSGELDKVHKNSHSSNFEVFLVLLLNFKVIGFCCILSANIECKGSIRLIFDFIKMNLEEAMRMGYYWRRRRLG